jgi:hypothetical protein
MSIEDGSRATMREIRSKDKIYVCFQRQTDDELVLVLALQVRYILYTTERKERNTK